MPNARIHIAVAIVITFGSLQFCCGQETPVRFSVADSTTETADPPIPLPAPRPEYPAAPGDSLESVQPIETYADGCDACELGQAKQRTWSGRLYSALMAAACDCDRCDRPEWTLLESASFFLDSARPQNRTRFRWDYGPNLIFADRNEYFMARIGGSGPALPRGTRPIDYHELSQMTEIAHGNFSTFVITPYRSLDMDALGHEAGFSDVQIGTKSLLHDSPLLQVAFQMTTTVPSANPRKGLGIGHVALEPSLLFGLCLTDRAYLQAQIAQWTPLGGDPGHAGALSRWGFALNQEVWRRDADNRFTVNFDLFGYSFQDGAYTDSNGVTQPSNNETYLYLGPGFRWLLCGKFEFGLGSVYAVTRNHFAEQIVRSEVILRY